MTTKFLFNLLFFCCLTNTAQVMWHFTKDSVITWNYFDGDEFNGDKVDTDVWDYSFGGTHTLFNNLEQQYYTNGNNHIVSNGSLKLIAKKETITAKVNDWMRDNDSMIIDKKFFTLNKKDFDYTSGMLRTKKTYRHGFFECRFKIPANKGYWPAFWLHGGYPNEEIDMMECKSEKSNQIHIDVHCPNKCDVIKYLFHKRSFGGWVTTKYNLTKQYVIVACDWAENYVKFYIDGYFVGASYVNFNIEKYLTLNIAVPGNKGPFNPAPDKNNTEEAVFEIDYVRTWIKSTNIKDKQTTNQLTNIYTTIETANNLTNKPNVKTTNNLLKGKNYKQEAFISYFNTTNYIQITTLGVFSKEKPKYKIISKSGSEVLNGVIETKLLTVDKTNLKKGDEYTLIISHDNKLVNQVFLNQ